APRASLPSHCSGASPHSRRPTCDARTPTSPASHAALCGAMRSPTLGRVSATPRGCRGLSHSRRVRCTSDGRVRVEQYRLAEYPAWYERPSPLLPRRSHSPPPLLPTSHVVGLVCALFPVYPALVR